MANSGAGTLSALVNLAVWLTGVLVSLAVGFGMVDGVLGVRWIPVSVIVVAGWVVVILTLVNNCLLTHFLYCCFVGLLTGRIRHRVSILSGIKLTASVIRI